jgi:hypothetical protein
MRSSIVPRPSNPGMKLNGRITRYPAGGWTVVDPASALSEPSRVLTGFESVLVAEAVWTGMPPTFFWTLEGTVVNPGAKGGQGEYPW